jgi:hypothetical protein
MQEQRDVAADGHGDDEGATEYEAADAGASDGHESS